MTDTIQHVATVFPVNHDSLLAGIKRQRRRSIIRDFALNTSTHGLPGIARSQSVHNRVFWSVSTAVFTGVMVYFVAQSISNYFQYPKQTSIDVIVEWPIVFPAVSFCNYSPVRQDRFFQAFLEYLSAFNLIDTTNNTNFTLSNYVIYIHDFYQWKINQNKSMYDLYFPLSSMLMSCFFNGVPCVSTDFISFESPLYGGCYTFNAKRKNLPNSGIRYSNEGGRDGILELRLYVHSHQYVPNTSDAVGIMIMVHDNTQLPLIDIAGMALEPGRKHKLSFTRKKSYFLSPPYTQCTNQIPLAMQAMFNLFQDADYAYSQLICFTNCIQAYTYHVCGCVNPNQWLARFAVLFGTDIVVNAPLCNMTDACFTEAADRLMKTYAIWSMWCPYCQQECNTTTFGITLSSMSAPREWMMNSIRDFVEASSVPLPSDWSTAWHSHIQSNYIAIDIVRGSIQLEQLTQVASLSGVDLLSNVGGLSGLWIGISFLSLMELAEMLYRLFRSNIHQIHIKIRQNTQVTQFSNVNNHNWKNTNAFN
ncbi:unnamed protein product [Rotaria sp. Silwood2]|nr:unnamed protein product [Rotaria sp. Silwood2]